MDTTTAIGKGNHQGQIGQLIEDRVAKPLKRIQTSAMTRAYFRRMRAAEMAAWEMTGGDYVVSCFLAQA